MDLNDLKPSVRLQDRIGYVYHTVFRRPTDGQLFHYIGRRTRRHLDKTYSGSGHWLKRLERKYGRGGNTKLYVLSWGASSEELDKDEVYFIAEARRLWPDSCVNLQSGGLRGSGATCCESTRRKNADAARRKVWTDEARAKIAAWARSWERPASLCEKISERKKAANESKPIGCCPHCNREGRMTGAFKQWHFGNCKAR